MMNSVIQAILKINPNAQISVSNNDINTIVWENGTTPIPLADIQAKIGEIEVEYNAKQYQRNRATAYPSFADQFDLLYHGGYDAWKAAIDAVKQQFPKPE